MITLRQLERLWQAKSFSRMSALLLEMRPESSPRLLREFSRSLPIAALSIIRLDELSQAYTPFCARMIRKLLASQEADGGFGDVLTTAIAIRALSCSSGHGQAIDRALDYLARLQKDDGSWPAVPIRRIPGDSFTTATVLFYLADHEQFAQSANPHQAHAWLATQEHTFDADTIKLCRPIRARPTPALSQQPALTWS